MIMGTFDETAGYVTAEAHKTQQEGVSQQEMEKAVLEWAKRICEEEAARPANQAVARLHYQTKSRGTPPRIHVWED